MSKGSVYHLNVSLKIHVLRCWTNASVAKIISWFYREPEFNSQYPHWVTHLYLQLQKNQMSLASKGTCTHVCIPTYRHTDIDTHVIQNNINKSFKAIMC